MDTARLQAIDLGCILSFCNERVQLNDINIVQVEKHVEFNLSGNYSVPALYT